MRKIYIELLLLTSLYANTLPAQSPVTFTPEKPKPGSTVSFIYDPATTVLAGKDSITAYAYLLEEGVVPIAQDITLTKTGSLFKGEITTTDTTLAFFLSFDKDGTRDNTKEFGYYSYLYATDGNPLPGARKAVGQTGLNYGDVWGLEVEAATANKLIKEDYALHPGLKEKHKTEYLNILARSKEASDKTLLEEMLEKILTSTTPKESDLQAAKDLYTRLKHNDKAARADSLMRSKFPQGIWARGELLAALSAATQGAQKEELYNKLRTAYPPISQKDSALFSNIASMMADLYLEENNHEKALQYAALVRSKRSRAYIYNDVARKLAGDSLNAKPADAQKSKELAVLSLQLIGEEIENGSNDRPLFYTSTQWKEMQKRSRATFSDTYALLLYNLSDYENAYVFQQKAVTDNKRNDIAMNEAYALYTEKVKGPAAASGELESFVKAGKASTKMKEQFKRIYLAGHYTENQWMTYLTELEKGPKARERAKLAREMLNIPAPSFVLKDLDGKDIALASLKGKIVIVDFWATWCGPCLASFPGMKMAVDKYKNDPDIKFVFIDTRESGDRDKIQKEVATLVQKHAWPFHILMDYDGKVIDQFNVPGIPTKFIIDKNSMIRFKSAGYGGTPEELVDEITNMIEVAKTAF